jgi:hypothetical protein
MDARGRHGLGSSTLIVAVEFKRNQTNLLPKQMPHIHPSAHDCPLYLLKKRIQLSKTIGSANPGQREIVWSGCSHPNAPYQIQFKRRPSLGAPDEIACKGMKQKCLLPEADRDSCS